MTVQLRAAIARIRQANGKVVGAGFLVSDQHILTCAHVVNAALGKQLNVRDRPNQEIDLDFPLVASGNILRGRVVRWIPVQKSSSILPETGADIALLELESTLPEGTQPIRLVKAENLWKHPFRVFGFPEGQAVGVWTDGIISNPQANGRVQIEVVRATAYPIEPGFSGSPVWDEQLDGVAGMTVAIDSKRPQVRAAFIIPTTQLINACPELEEQAIPPCPYRGLFAFREQDAKFFFGREQFTQKLVKAVHKQSLVAVIGASGSGKSSVVFAGLIPQLRSEEGWLIEGFRPGDRPLRNLTKTIVALRKIETIDPLDQIDQMVEKFQEGKRKLRDVIEDILDRNNRTRLLLIADQFEELYTLCKDKSERQIFLDIFLEGVNQTENLTLVLTLRADFCGYALSYRPFADALQDADRKLGPMNREELQKVIEKPAQLLGVRIESGLTERILEAVEDEPGYLPLLEFALTLLWAKQQNGQLTHQAYEDIGGVEKALAEYAEEQYQNL
ncbi:MAG: serine protease, partial [Moorea sp. SIO2I5]|nr:serine protease [Moorena sp. SIO2I5]